MKKLLSVIISATAVFIIVFSFNIFADDMDEGIGGNELYGSLETDEILADMDLISSELESYDISPEDIDLNRVTRVYPTVDIFSVEIKSSGEMRNCIANMTYVYALPIDSTEPWYSITLTKGNGVPDYGNPRLDDEGIKWLEERNGRWHCSEIRQYDGKSDRLHDYNGKINTFLEFYGIEDSETFFIGGTTTNSVSIAVCYPNDGSQGAYYIALDEFPLNPQSIEEIQGAVYTFDEIKEYARDITPQETGTGDEYATMYFGGMGSASAEPATSQWLYVIIAVVLCAAVAATIIVVIVTTVKKRRSRA